MKGYEGKHAIIVGGTKGIGLAIAKKLLDSKAKVTVTGRNPFQLEGANSLTFDITNESQTNLVLSEYFEESGVPDYLFICAGYSRPGYFLDVPKSDVTSMMNLNFFGTHNVIDCALPLMLKEGAGHIVTTSSMAGYLGLFGYSGYCASKFAVIGYTESLKREFEPFGIKFSVICPPGTRTPGFDEENKLKPSEVLEMEKSAKIASPEEIALASLKQIMKNRFMVLPTRDAKLAYYLNRYTPWVIELALKKKKKVLSSSHETSSQLSQ